jgi:hypothetical protein
MNTHHVCIRVRTHMHIIMHIHVCIHTHTHTHTNIHTQLYAGDMDGIKSICNFVQTAKSDPSHELARGLLVNLGRGRKASTGLDQNLISLLHSDEPKVQRTAANVLRQLLAPAKVEGVAAATPSVEIISALYRMFASSQVHVLYEAQELGLLALCHRVTCAEMVRSAVAMLRPDPYSFSSRRLQTPTDAELYGSALGDATLFDDDTPLPETLLRQSSAARLIASYVSNGQGGSLLPDNVGFDKVMEHMIQEGVVPNLLVAIANTDFVDSKKYGGIALTALVKSSHAADQILHQLTGTSFHRLWHADTSDCIRSLDYASLNNMLQGTGHPHLLYFKDGQRPAHMSQDMNQGEADLGMQDGMEAGSPSGLSDQDEDAYLRERLAEKVTFEAEKS